MKSTVNFDNLTYEKFKELARSPSLTNHEKVGFPNDYREGKEDFIFSDIIEKLHGLLEDGKVVLEIGPGCSELPKMLSRLCHLKSHDLHFIDSQEMLDLLPHGKHITKWPGKFSEVTNDPNFMSRRVDIILAYSVVQYIYLDGNFWEFLEKSLNMLRRGGQMLLGDIPNTSMRKRFLLSPDGEIFQKKIVDAPTATQSINIQLPAQEIDDDVICSILSKARNKGFHAWVLRQGHNLPMANRREDILIECP